MKKAMFLGVCFFWMLAGCSNPIKEDLSDYINKKIPKVAETETAAIKAWESVSGDNYTDDYTMYETLSKTVIPTYREFITGVEEITVQLKTKEVRAINEKYIEAASLTNNAFILLLNILETQDTSRITDFTERLDKARRLVREWRLEIQDLCKKNGVSFNPEW